MNLQQKKAYIKNLDFSDIIQLMSSKQYMLAPWIKREATYCAELYKCFLTLILLYPDENLIPSQEIDEFWHNHILDTNRYMNDCNIIFGKYQHHAPSYIIKKSAKSIDHQFQRTVELFKKEFDIEL